MKRSEACRQYLSCGSTCIPRSHTNETNVITANKLSWWNLMHTSGWSISDHLCLYSAVGSWIVSTQRRHWCRLRLNSESYRCLQDNESHKFACHQRRGEDTDVSSESVGANQQYSGRGWFKNWTLIDSTDEQGRSRGGSFTANKTGIEHWGKTETSNGDDHQDSTLSSSKWDQCFMTSLCQRQRRNQAMWGLQGYHCLLELSALQSPSNDVYSRQTARQAGGPLY